MDPPYFPMRVREATVWSGVSPRGHGTARGTLRLPLRTVHDVIVAFVPVVCGPTPPPESGVTEGGPPPGHDLGIERANRLPRSETNSATSPAVSLGSDTACVSATDSATDSATESFSWSFCSASAART